MNNKLADNVPSLYKAWDEMTASKNGHKQKEVFKELDEESSNNVMTNKEQLTEESVHLMDDYLNEDNSSKESQSSKWRSTAGYIMILLRVIAALLQGIIIKKYLKNFSLPVLLLYRANFAFTVALPWSVVSGRPAFEHGQTFKTHCLLVLRGGISFVHSLACFYSVRCMPIGNSMIISSTKSIFVTMFSAIFLKEKFGWTELASVVLMMSGVMLVMLPSVLFSPTDPLSTDSELWAGLLLILATILTANATIILRFLKNEHLPGLVASREMMLIILFFNLVMITGYDLETPDLHGKLTLVLLAALNILSSLFQATALRVLPASHVSIIEKSGLIVVSYIIQFLLFFEYPSYLTCIGIGLSTLSIVVLIIKCH